MVCAVLDEVAQRCASTAMCFNMHLAALAAYQAAVHPPVDQLRAAARGEHVSTLAFSEFGSRSHFWAPVSQERRNGDRRRPRRPQVVRDLGRRGRRLRGVDALERGQGARPSRCSTWCSADDAGLGVAGTWDALGMRGNASAPMTLREVSLPASRALTEPGQGLAMMLGAVLPIFNVGSAAISSASPRRPPRSRSGTSPTSAFEYSGMKLADLPNERARLAQMRIETDRARAYLAATLDALEQPGPTTMLHVLESKAAAAEAALTVTDTALRACGGAGVHQEPRPRARLPRRARRGGDGAHHRRAPRVHRPGAVRDGAVLMATTTPRPVVVGAVLYDPKVSVIWDIIRDFFEARGCPMDVVLYANYERQVDGAPRRARSTSPGTRRWPGSTRSAGRSGRCRAIAMRDTDRDRVSLVVVRGDRARSRRSPTCAGSTLAVGALDSPQATLIPLGLLQRAGLEPGRDVTVKRFDVLVGKHGDHVGGERDAFRCLERGEADASTVLDLNWKGWTKDGTIDPDAVADPRRPPTASITASSPCAPTSSPSARRAGSKPCSR